MVTKSGEYCVQHLNALFFESSVFRANQTAALVLRKTQKLEEQWPNKEWLEK